MKKRDTPKKTKGQKPLKGPRKQVKRAFSKKEIARALRDETIIDDGK